VLCVRTVRSLPHIARTDSRARRKRKLARLRTAARGTLPPVSGILSGVFDTATRTASVTSDGTAHNGDDNDPSELFASDVDPATLDVYAIGDDAAVATSTRAAAVVGVHAARSAVSAAFAHNDDDDNNHDDDDDDDARADDVLGEASSPLPDSSESSVRRIECTCGVWHATDGVDVDRRHAVTLCLAPTRALRTTSKQSVSSSKRARRTPTLMLTPRTPTLMLTPRTPTLMLTPRTPTLMLAPHTLRAALVTCR
jgi:hypothetical protein